MKTRIMLVDDEDIVLKSLIRLLRRPDWEIEAFAGPELAIKALEHSRFHVVVSDYRMPGIDGVQFLEYARARDPDMVRIILSAMVDRDALVEAINTAEVYRVLAKPWDNHDLIATVERAAELAQMKEINRQLLAQLRQRDGLLMDLSQQHPDLLQVQFDADGALVLDDDGSQ